MEPELIMLQQQVADLKAALAALAGKRSAQRCRVMWASLLTD
jgi:hypothetical protein